MENYTYEGRFNENGKITVIIKEALKKIEKYTYYRGQFKENRKKWHLLSRKL